MRTPEAALYAVDAALVGWFVFPVGSGRKRRPPTGWPDLATDDPLAVERWRTDGTGPPAWAVHLGRSGLAVVDADGDEGRASLAAMERELGPLPKSLCVQTPGGEHRYFTDPGGIARRLRWRPGLDILAGVHFAIGPGSRTDAGEYRLDHDEEPFDPACVAVLPERWAAALKRVDPECDGEAHTIAPIPPTPDEVDDVDGADGADGGDGADDGDTIEDIFARYPLIKRHTSNTLIFKLARDLRFLPRYRETTRPTAVVLDALRGWWEAGRDHTQRSWAETLADFTGAWGRIRFDRDDLAEALEAAKAAGCDPVVSEALPDPADAPARLLAALAAELARRSEDGVFYLAQKEAGRVLGIKREKAGALMRLFQSLGWMELIEPGSYADGRANTYRWLLGDKSDATAGAGSHDPA